jgi:hypothetical protein
MIQNFARIAPNVVFLLHLMVRSIVSGSPIMDAKTPQEYVSIDAFKLKTKGLISQLKGNLRKCRYTSSTVFVDHYSELTFVYMQKDLSIMELIKTKTVFLLHARTGRVIM